MCACVWRPGVDTHPWRFSFLAEQQKHSVFSVTYQPLERKAFSLRTHPLDWARCVNGIHRGGGAGVGLPLAGKSYRASGFLGLWSRRLCLPFGDELFRCPLNRHASPRTHPSLRAAPLHNGAVPAAGRAHLCFRAVILCKLLWAEFR